jgi:drug/metabolite transporter (DMT)-like permease
VIPSSEPHASRRIGIGLVSLATLGFSTIDVCGKWLVQSLPVVEVVWLRFVTHAVWMIALLAPVRGRAIVRMASWRLQALRALMLAVMTGLNFWALQYLQLAETGAIQFSVPLIIAGLSALWLGERLGASRWAAILVGFVGVLVVMRPGTQGFHPAILLSVLNAVLYAMFNLLTRRMAATESAESMQLISAIGAALVLTPFALAVFRMPQGWQTWAVIAAIGLAGGLGHLFAAMAHRHATAAVLGPFLYQQILYMTAWGWLVFGQVPDGFVIGGAAIVVASGLYLLWMEMRQR